MEKKNYKEIKSILAPLMLADYKSYIKAIVSIECDVDDEKILDAVYDDYMHSDYSTYLSDSIVGMLTTDLLALQETLN